jgi:hypothetical protein
MTTFPGRAVHFNPLVIMTIVVAFVLASLTLGDPAIADDGPTPAGSGSISGTVTGEPGDGPVPLEGVEVRAYIAGVQVASTPTSATGAYELSNLAPGLYKLYFQPDPATEYVGSYWDGSDTDVDALVLDLGPAEEITNISPQLKIGGSLSGTVASGTVSSPTFLEDVDVTALRRITDGWVAVAGVRTDEFGQYSLRGLAVGLYQVRFEYTQGESVTATQYFDGRESISEDDALTVQLGDEFTSINALFGSVVGSIFGEPIPGFSQEPALFEATVGLYLKTGETWRRVSTTSTDSSGGYRFGGLGSGRYGILVQPSAAAEPFYEPLPAGGVSGLDTMPRFEIIGFAPFYAPDVVLPSTGLPDVSLELIIGASGGTVGNDLMVDLTGTNHRGVPVNVSTAKISSSIGSDIFTGTAREGWVFTARLAGNRTLTAIFAEKLVSIDAALAPGATRSLLLSAARNTVTAGGTVDFTTQGFDVYGNATDAAGAVINSSQTSDVIDGQSVRFVGEGERRITAQLGELTSTVTITVTPVQPSGTTTLAISGSELPGPVILAGSLLFLGSLLLLPSRRRALRE